MYDGLFTAMFRGRTLLINLARGNQVDSPHPPIYCSDVDVRIAEPTVNGGFGQDVANIGGCLVR